MERTIATPDDPTITITISRLQALTAGKRPKDNTEKLLLEFFMERPLQTFRVGDVVVLRSGSHLMTVETTDCGSNPTTLLGLVFSDGKRIVEAEVPRGCLRLATEAEIARANGPDDIPF